MWLPPFRSRPSRTFLSQFADSSFSDLGSPVAERVESARGAIRDRVDRFFHIFRAVDLHREQADGRECCNKTTWAELIDRAAGI
jgi:hypothetical protein